MTATMSNPTIPLPAETGAVEQRAAAFAAAVRERLSDLPTDEVDELLDGLQGDLTERLAESADAGDVGTGELGDPEAYADELRQAAGLPERSDENAKKTRRPLRIAIRNSWVATGERLEAYWGATPGRRAVRDFMLALRPIWWVIRGLVIAWVGIAVFAGVPRVSVLANSPLLVLIGLACIVVSVQWGRGRWVPQRWLVWLRRAASLGAIVALLPVTEFVWNDISSEPSYETEAYYDSGLTHDGAQIGNIFAYDCSGAPLDGVQLFTREGEPLTTLENGEAPWSYDDDGASYQYQQNPLATMPNGWNGWNVFPLRQAEQNMNTGELGPATEVTAPFAKVPALSENCPVAGSPADDSPVDDEAADGPGDGSAPATDAKAGE